MPEPVGGGQRYVPGLDGLRALAVLAVIAYHVDLGWAQGGLLGVGIFFTLSGYLITDLLLAQSAATGRLNLLNFWQRRARRLLPALFVMLAVVVGWVALLQRAQLGALRGSVGAAAGYFSNWWLIAHNSSYFARFGPPSPLGHLWSLAIEEQFYLIWPWLLLIGLFLIRKRTAAQAWYWLVGVTLALAVVSVVLMAVLYHPGYDPTRTYDGTDTRAFALLIGAALAFVKPSRSMPSDVSTRSRLTLDGIGAAGLLVIVLLIWLTGQYSPFLYRGGMVLLSVATAAVVLAVVSPAGQLGKLLGWAPLRWLGVRSYGIYLWHFPIIVLTTPASGAEGFVRGSLQIAATVVVAALSWHFIEEPIRHGALSRWYQELKSGAWRAGRRGWATMTAAVGVPTLALLAFTGAVPAASAGQSPAGVAPLASARLPSVHGITNGSPDESVAERAATPAFPLKTSCRSVVHFGDSTSDGLNSSNYLPNPADRIKEQYADVGVARTVFEIQGATSVVETINHLPNTYTVAKRLVHSGYRGCWVLAIGTNDTADVAVGSNIGLAARIKLMMSVIGTEPVMWVNVKSLVSHGPYSEKDMQEWDQALLAACHRYPNMRIYNWAAVAQRPWFIPDGIHYTSPGYVQRSRMIAQALAEAFPDPSSLNKLPRTAARMLTQTGCIVG
ncbi:MAG TPA: acyltransferase family protein [Streptosporangiaceae bacterium]|nr:acyltransferase family protein [Streptosporangiaceae bacterium]